MASARWLLLFVTGCSSTSAAVVAPEDAAPADVADARSPLLPALEGAPWTIAHVPDLGALNDPGQQPVDFAIWQAADGTWQLWSCIRHTQEPGESRLFYRWESPALENSDWTPVGIAMHADPTLGETPGGLQAPYVFRIGDVWHMFYGTWDAIAHATSTDGKAFTRVVQPGGTTALFSDGAGNNTRDPMVLVEGDRYYVYDTAMPAGVGTDFVRTSADLATFSAPTIAARGGVAGNTTSSAECPFVVHQPDDGAYYLFRTEHYGPSPLTHVYRSSSPTSFGVDDDSMHVGTLPIAAPEIFRVGVQWYVASVRADYQGIEVSRLAWRAAP
jgi:hypothetical protein